MVNTRQVVKLDKKDYYRALMTDTISSDVPVIFSNDGLYINFHRNRLLGARSDACDHLVSILFSKIIATDANGLKPMEGQSSPLKYKILKDDVSLRTLSLLHPRAQNSFVQMYDENRRTIAYLCSLSPLSIRAPVKVGSSFYSSKYKNANKNKYKDISIDTLENELKKRFASTYFTYKGVDRIFKIFNQKRYIELEKQFSHMWFLDVANCFDSIYTHSVAWAIKEKEYVKSKVGWANQFCQKFDTLMQRSNNNETNGITIGSEVSRVFSEIIFQRIDLNIIEKARVEHKLKLDVDYAILRYVDDYIFFAKNQKNMVKISNVISDCLNEYNLYVSDSKLKKYSRPFCTKRTNTIINLNSLIDHFDNALFYCDESGRRLGKPKKIFNKKRFIQAFIDKVKSLCVSGEHGYADVSSYLISAFSRRVVNIINSSKEINFENPDLKNSLLEVRGGISILLELMFFFYTVSPSISSSNKIAKTIIISDKFFDKNMPEQLDYFRTEVMLHINSLSLDKNISDIQRGFISIERMNIILASSNFGSNYLLSNEVFDTLFEQTEKMDYFTIVSLLYYFKDHGRFADYREKLEAVISSKFDSYFKLIRCSERAHLFLDILSCPFVSTSLKKKYLNKFYSENDLGRKSEAVLENDISLLGRIYWFIKWNDLDLQNLLERKELHSIY